MQGSEIGNRVIKLAGRIRKSPRLLAMLRQLSERELNLWLDKKLKAKRGKPACSRTFYGTVGDANAKIAQIKRTRFKHRMDPRRNVTGNLKPDWCNECHGFHIERK